MVEPAAVALHAVRISRLKAGDTAAVAGAGPIGLLLIESLRIAGASAIHVVEPSAERRAKALETGRGQRHRPRRPRTRWPRAAALAPGGVNACAFEVTGVPCRAAATSSTPRATGRDDVIDTRSGGSPGAVSAQYRRAQGTPVAGHHRLPRCLSCVMDLMVEELVCAPNRPVTKRIALDDIVDQGFETLVNEKTQIKILVNHRTDRPLVAHRFAPSGAGPAT
ncbi:hypothetical protein PE067_06090 [Paracoccus sp. DMF-8]|uniref:hypothetical protein n=1 Tax=Paracoccus sp. DMF-8 TaxID=3019445 RepID=UPI0023E76E8B|nr:hypothetical protein [Paracoccus sp. DMF-8]MDF3605754.1 hypothetical protein [Paracoccus sp. DMF-8]